jgi:spore coat protein U-like protein
MDGCGGAWGNIRSRRMRQARATILCAALLAAPAIGRAQSCTLSTVGLDLGLYDPFSSVPLDGTGSVSYHCQGGLRGVATLSPGSSGRFDRRTMLHGAERLVYNVYLDAARTRIWGDLQDGGQVADIRPGRRSISVYGRVFPQQGVSPGTYADTLVVTFYF